MPSNPSEHYEVLWPGPILQQLKLWGERAKQRGIGPVFAGQIRQIIKRLSSRPLIWGEQRGTLHGRNLPVLHGALSLLHVQYAVDKEAGVAFVMQVQLMANSPLEDIS